MNFEAGWLTDEKGLQSYLVTSRQIVSIRFLRF